MKKDFPALTGVRALAAVLVFLHHYAEIMYAGQPHDFGYFLLRQLNIGVNVFFVLSGFLITYRYYPLEVNLCSFRKYWWNRAVRILPLYYAILFLQIALRYFQNGSLPDAFTLFLNVSLLKGLSATSFYSVMTQSWSLTVEEMFYVYAPFCFLLIRRGYWFAQFALLLALGFYLTWFSQQTDAGFFGGTHFMLASTFFGRCFEFFVGVCLALLVRKKQTAERKGVGFTAAGASLFVLLVTALALYAYRENINVVTQHAVGIALFNFFIPLSVGLLYFGLVSETSWLQRILATKLFVVLGRSSYAFYLLHIGMVAEIFYFHVTSNLFLLFVLLQLVSIAAEQFFRRPAYYVSVVSSSLQVKTYLRSKTQTLEHVPAS